MKLVRGAKIPWSAKPLGRQVLYITAQVDVYRVIKLVRGAKIPWSAKPLGRQVYNSTSGRLSGDEAIARS